jgi:hypothetical protein
MAPADDDPWSGCNPTDPAFRDDPYPRCTASARAIP